MVTCEIEIVQKIPQCQTVRDVYEDRSWLHIKTSRNFGQSQTWGRTAL